MNISGDGLTLIQEHEGLRLDAYLDSGGVPTIGWGHIHGVRMGDSCTKDEALGWLFDDLIIAERCVNASVKNDITQTAFDALVSFTFNLGCGALRTSTLLRKLNEGDELGAAEEFKRWNHVHGVVVAGLTERRKAEMELFLA